MNSGLELLKSGGDTDTGLIREHNEDRLLLLPDIGVFAVVDGMGGENAGEKAAEIAVAVLKAHFLNQEQARESTSLHHKVQRAILDANNRIFEAAAASPEWSGMACVLTVAVIRGDKITVGHVGDSRLYKLTRLQIAKLTRDHSPVGVREDANEISEFEAMNDLRRNEVFRDVGSQIRRESDPEFVDVFEEVLEPESAILLCSDGLTDMITATQIHKVVLENAGNPLQSSRELIRIANEAGGRDNVSAIVIEGARFKEGVWGEPASQKSRHAIVEFLRPLASRPALFLYGVLAGVSLLLYIQVSSIGGSVGFAWNSPRVLRVSPDGGRFLTISEALRAARPGDRVEVEPGEYREALVLPDGVTLISTTPHTAIIRPPLTASFAVGIQADGVQANVSGFRILPGESGLDIGIRLKDATVNLSSLEVAPSTIAGIQIEGNTSGLIKANVVESGSETALLIKGTNAVRLELNSFGRSRASLPTVKVEEGATATLVRNIIEGHPGSPAVSAAGPLLDEIAKSNHFTLGNPQSSTGSKE